MATMDLTTLPPPGNLLTGLLRPLHLGALHPAEQVLVYLLAFGPFAVLAVVAVVRRRRDRREDETAAAPSPGGSQRDR
jgi:hypothetical protein